MVGDNLWFSTILMTGHAAPIEIGNAFFIVLINRTGFIMTLVAIDIYLRSIVAVSAKSIRIPVIHGESVTLDGNIAPIIRVMAL